MELKKTISGYTLAELLVAVSILSILSASAIVGLMNVSSQGKIAQTVVLVRKVESAARQHYADTGQWPATYTLPNADDPSQNPLINGDIDGDGELDVKGWAGPYLSNKPSEHAWSGALRWVTISADYNNNGNSDEFMIVLDDDAPGTGSGDNTGIIPHDAIVDIDRELDDGVLETGNVRGDNPRYEDDETCEEACLLEYFNLANNEVGILVE